MDTNLNHVYVYIHTNLKDILIESGINKCFKYFKENWFIVKDINKK